MAVLLQACRRAGVLGDARCSCTVALARLVVRNVLRCRVCGTRTRTCCYAGGDENACGSAGERLSGKGALTLQHLQKG
jgi:hypothetical protein